MTEHQFSARFKKDTPEAFKNEEFQKRLGEFFAGFIDCYPHLIEKPEFDSENETWVFKFSVEVPEIDKKQKGCVYCQAVGNDPHYVNCPNGHISIGMDFGSSEPEKTAHVVIDGKIVYPKHNIK